MEEKILKEILNKLNRLEIKVDKLEEKVSKIDKLEEKINKIDKLEEKVSKIDKLEEKINKIDKIEEKVNKIDKLEEKINKIDKLEEKVSKIDSMEIELKKLNKKLDDYIEVEKNHYKSTCNEFDRINKKIDSNFVYLDKKIDNTKDKIVTEMIDVLESFSVNISNSIENVDSKIDTESKERQYQIERLNNLTEYDKIVLKNLESRISILEEESQDYRRATN